MVKRWKSFSVLMVLLLMLSLVAIALPPMAGTVEAATPIYVNGTTGDNNNNGETPGTAVKTIAKGIELVDPDGTVNVADGTYTITSPIDVNKGVTITGNVNHPENVVVTYAAPSQTLDCFDMQVNNVTVQGISAVNGRYGFNFAASDPTGCTISDCVIDHCYEGAINIDGGSGHTISSNTITNCLTSGGHRGDIHIEACPDVTISGNTMTGNGLSSGKVEPYHTTIEIYVKHTYPVSSSERVEIIGNTISGHLGDCADIQVYDAPYTYIYNNTISNSEDKGIAIFGIHEGGWAYTSTDNRVQVIGNTISSTYYPGVQACNAPYTYFYNNTLTRCNYYGGDGTGDFDYASIHIDVGSSDCLIDSNTVSDGINGIQIWSDNCTITNNTIYDMGKTYADTKTTTDGTYYNSAILYGDMYDVNMPASATISNNNIYDNYWGLFVISAYTGIVTAENNWWGDASGPGGVGPGTGDAVSDSVDYCPWLLYPYPQPLTEVWVDNDWAGRICGDEVEPSKYFGINAFDKIQDGIDAVAGSTVNVAGGTYNPTSTIIINKDSLILQGPQANVDPRPSYGSTRTAGSASEAVIDGSTSGLGIIIKIEANNVVINGLEVKSGAGDMIKQQDTPHSGTTVKYCIIHDGLGDEGVQLKKCTDGILEYNYVYDIADEGDGLNIADTSSNGVIRHNEVCGIHGENAAIYIYDATDMEISDNLVYGPGGPGGNDGIKVGNKGGDDAAKTGVLVKDNVIHGMPQDGITIYMSGVTVEGNEIYNCGSENGAIYLAYGISDVTIQGNSIHDNVLDPGKWAGTSAGIFVKSDVVGPVSINYNNIYNNTLYGVTNKAAALLDATNNWWGSAVEPSAQVSGNVNYTPWANGLRAYSGDSQTGTVGTALANPFVAQLKNSGGTEVAISGITATYAISTYPDGATGQSLSVTDTATDANGQSSSTLTLGNKAGTYTVTTNVPGETTATFTATATAGSLDHIVVSPDTATVITAGATQTYTTEAFDADNNSLGDKTTETAFTIDAGAGGSWADNVYTSEKVGIWTVTGSYSGKSDTAALTVNPAASHTVTLTADPKSITADGTSTSTVTATVKDEYGNNVADDTEVVFTTTKGTLSSDTATTTSGQAHVTLTSSTTAETATVTATANSASASTAVFFTKAGVTVTDSKEEETAPGDQTVDAKNEADTEVEKSGTGTPTVTVAKYSDNPAGDTPGGFQTAGDYIDVHLDNTTNVTEIQIKTYYTDAEVAAAGVSESSLRLRWWNGSAWAVCSDSGVDTTDIAGPPAYSGYMWAKIRDDTTPNLTDLAGAMFGGMGTPPAVGGGGSVPSPHTFTVNFLGKTTTASINWDGWLKVPFEASSPDAKCKLEIDKDTRILTAEGRAASRISVEIAGTPPPPPNTTIVGSVYDFTPNGLKFSKPVLLTLGYDPSELPENTSSLNIARYDAEKGWTNLELEMGGIAEVAGLKGGIGAGVNHFTYFAILAKLAPTLPSPPSPIPAAFSTTNLSITPTSVEAGETLTITAKVTNSGGTEGSYTAILKINGITEATEELTLAPDASKVVSFNIEAGDVAGDYTVELDGQSATFTVIAKPTNWALIGGIIAVLMIIGIGILIAIRRKAALEG